MVEKQRKSEWPLEKQGTFPPLFRDLETKKLFPLFFHCFSMEKQKPSCSATTNPTQHTMSFTASSPARVSVTRDVVDDRSMRSLSPWNFTPQPFGLLQSPSLVLATAASSEAANDNLVVVEVPAVETPVVERLFLDNEKEIEFLGQKGPSNTEVESEVDEPVQPVHDPWSTARINASAWGGVDPPVDLDVLHRALIQIDDHQGDHWFKVMTIEDKLDLATSMLNVVQPKIHRLHQDLCQEATVCVF